MPEIQKKLHSTVPPCLKHKVKFKEFEKTNLSLEQPYTSLFISSYTGLATLDISKNSLHYHLCFQSEG